jgi:hypothetical protein
MRKFDWTEEQLAYLREHYPTGTAFDIAEVIGCSETTVRLKAHALGIQKDPSFRRTNFIGRYVRRGVIKDNTTD